MTERIEMMEDEGKGKVDEDQVDEEVKLEEKDQVERQIMLKQQAYQQSKRRYYESLLKYVELTQDVQPII